jgi:hypothetical protein
MDDEHRAFKDWMKKFNRECNYLWRTERGAKVCVRVTRQARVRRTVDAGESTRPEGLRARDTHEIGSRQRRAVASHKQVA